MYQQSSPHERTTSELAHIQEINRFVAREDTFSKFQKTIQEKTFINRVKSNHKKALRRFYGKEYSSRILNLPKYRYEIITSTH